MQGTVGEFDDYVVDMVLEVDSRGIGVEELARRICLPGMEILRSTARGTIWLTALVTADGEAAAIREVRDSVLAQLPDRPRAVAAAVVSSIPLGDLYARLEEVLSDEELAEIDVRDLVARTMFDRSAADEVTVHLRPIDLAGKQRRPDTASYSA